VTEISLLRLAVSAKPDSPKKEVPLVLARGRSVLCSELVGYHYGSIQCFSHGMLHPQNWSYAEGLYDMLQARTRLARRWHAE